MRYSLTLPIMAALALEAVAHPMHHQHFHARRAVTALHAPKVARQFNDPAFAAAHPDIDFAEAYRKGMGLDKPDAPAPAPAPVPAPAPAAKPAAPAPAAGNSFKEKVKSTPDSERTTAASLVGLSLKEMVSTASNWFDSSSVALTALKNAVNVGSLGGSTCEGDACGGSMYSKGNMGSPYGSNMALVSSKDGNDFTHTIINSSPEDIILVIWNKSGKDGDPFTGQATALSGPALAFPLAKGAQQTVAFLPGSNAIFAPLRKNTGRITSGAPDAVWGEFNFLSTGPAYDVSSIASSTGNNYKLTMTNSIDKCVSSESVNHWISDNGGTSSVGIWKDPVPEKNQDACNLAKGTTSVHFTSELFG